MTPNISSAASSAPIIADALKATPPVVITGMTLFGYPLQDWVLVATLIYTLLQIVFVIRDKVFRNRRSAK